MYLSFGLRETLNVSYNNIISKGSIYKIYYSYIGMKILIIFNIIIILFPYIYNCINIYIYIYIYLFITIKPKVIIKLLKYIE
jgi:hypothetical protein